MAQNKPKPLFYFPHDAQTSQTEPMTRLRMQHSWAGYGLYWGIIEELRKSPDYSLPTNYKMLRFKLNISEAKIKSIIEDFDLFVIDYENGRFHSEMLTDSMTMMEQSLKKKSEAGKKGNATRWAKAHNTLDLQPLTDSETTKNVSQCDRNLSLIKENKIKENKIKENKIKHLNSPPPNLNEESAAAFEMVDLPTSSSVFPDSRGTSCLIREVFDSPTYAHSPCANALNEEFGGDNLEHTGQNSQVSESHLEVEESAAAAFEMVDLPTSSSVFPDSRGTSCLIREVFDSPTYAHSPFASALNEEFGGDNLEYMGWKWRLAGNKIVVLVCFVPWFLPCNV